MTPRARELLTRACFGILFTVAAAAIAWLAILLSGCAVVSGLAIHLPCRCPGGIRMSRTEAQRQWCLDASAPVCDAPSRGTLLDAGLRRAGGAP